LDFVCKENIDASPPDFPIFDSSAIGTAVQAGKGKDRQEYQC
jgi:hypothetical protein